MYKPYLFSDRHWRRCHRVDSWCFERSGNVQTCPLPTVRTYIVEIRSTHPLYHITLYRRLGHQNISVEALSSANKTKPFNWRNSIVSSTFNPFLHIDTFWSIWSIWSIRLLNSLRAVSPFSQCFQPLFNNYTFI